MSCYAGANICLTTKHGKEQVISPVFAAQLAAEVTVCDVDTDELGTFSGEKQRDGTALDCVRRKCLWGIEHLGTPYGLASEGSFGPHPQNPFIAADHELLCFIDTQNNIEVCESILTHQTNYHIAVINSWQELIELAKLVGFPSHALIVKPHGWQIGQPLIKGIQSQDTLHTAYQSCSQIAEDNKVIVETDMRAHLNPRRMAVIADLAQKMAKRILTSCPACHSPGWGITRCEIGLPCQMCMTPTKLIQTEISSCTKCDYILRLPRQDGLSHADPAYCPLCNP